MENDEKDFTTEENGGGLFSFFSNPKSLDKLPNWVVSFGFTGFVFFTLLIGLITVIQPMIMLKIERDGQAMELKISELEGKVGTSHDMLTTSLKTMKEQAESIAILKNKNELFEEREKVLIAREAELIKISDEKTKRIESLENEIFLLRQRVIELENIIKEMLTASNKNK